MTIRHSENVRQIRTFILRLLVDNDEPQVLRGVLRVVTENEDHPFTDEDSLLTLLHKMGRGDIPNGRREENSSCRR